MAITVPIISSWDGRGIERGMRDISKAEGGFGKFGAGVGALTPIAEKMGAGIAAAAAVAVKAASDQEQAFGGIEAVFKQNASAMETWSKSMSGVGISATDAADAATKIGASLKNAGLDIDQVTQQSQSLVGLGADLAATFGGSATDAVDALGAALRGETDPIERYGVSIKQSDVNARMAADGTANLTGQAAKNAEMMARLALISDQTADAQGRAGSEASGTFAGGLAATQAKVQNLAADLGNELLPYVTDFTDWIQKGVDWLGKHEGAMSTLVAVVGTFSGAILVANVAMKAFKAMQILIQAATMAWEGAQWLLNAALDANPIGVVVMAIAGLVAGLKYAYDHSETFRNIVHQLWAFLRNSFVSAWHAVGGAISGVVDWFRKAWDWVQNLWTRLNQFLSGPISALKSVGSTLGGLFSDVPDTVTAETVNIGAAPSLSRTALTYRAGGAGAVGARSSQTINVNGVQNPQTMAIELSRIITGARIRTGFIGVRA